jgi:hypothetical protein
VIAAQAPGLEEALERAVQEGTPYVILDGEIVSSDRCHPKTICRKARSCVRAPLVPTLFEHKRLE